MPTVRMIALGRMEQANERELDERVRGRRERARARATARRRHRRAGDERGGQQAPPPTQPRPPSPSTLGHSAAPPAPPPAPRVDRPRPAPASPRRTKPSPPRLPIVPLRPFARSTPPRLALAQQATAAPPGHAYELDTARPGTPPRLAAPPSTAVGCPPPPSSPARAECSSPRTLGPSHSLCTLLAPTLVQPSTPRPSRPSSPSRRHHPPPPSPRTPPVRPASSGELNLVRPASGKATALTPSRTTSLSPSCSPSRLVSTAACLLSHSTVPPLFVTRPRHPASPPRRVVTASRHSLSIRPRPPPLATPTQQQPCRRLPTSRRRLRRHEGRPRRSRRRSAPSGNSSPTPAVRPPLSPPRALGPILLDTAD